MDETKERKRPARMDRNSPEWERQANRLARDFCPGIHACADCGGPVVRGYCCTRCGSADPERRPGERA